MAAWRRAASVCRDDLLNRGCQSRQILRRCRIHQGELREMESLQQKLHDAHEPEQDSPQRQLRQGAPIADGLSRLPRSQEGQAHQAPPRSPRSLQRRQPQSPRMRPRFFLRPHPHILVNGLRKKLRDSMDAFTSIRNQISSEYRETVQRRYFTVTGENPDEKTVDLLISTGESETFLQKAIQEQGRGRVLDTISEIRERHESVKELERNLKELHQVFLDMAVLVQAQGEQLDDIESQVARANSFVTGGTQQLQTARKHQISSRKWTCYGIIILIVIILLIVLFTVRPWKQRQ
ncbi:Syntaxin-121 [Vitis vinifera]|uniref:Syntaxin-121 n=1 Tax=Vitis vinifera TaxID=29760 RepID=A0A438GKC7_VITVI|nr:Syntaxin-121 [Vitis vinifera]